MYVYCVKRFAHIECNSDCSRRGVILLNPFATVLFSVCNAVTVECCVLYPCCIGVFGMFAVMINYPEILAKMDLKNHSMSAIGVYIANIYLNTYKFECDLRFCYECGRSRFKT